MNLKQQTQFGAIWLQIENMNFQIELYFVERGSKKRCIQKKNKNRQYLE
jgi:hypothetical protein